MTKKYKVETQFKTETGEREVVSENLTRDEAIAKMKSMDNRKNHRHWYDPFYVVREQGENE